MPLFGDTYKLFKLAFTKAPLERKNSGGSLSATGIPSHDALSNLRSGDDGSGLIVSRDSKEFVDLSSISNRPARIKEYERLRIIPEIENALNVMSDEACVAGNTKIATVHDGHVDIKWLAENKANEQFPVYCYDFAKNDYTVGWAYNPRKTGKRQTIRLGLNDGTYVICTPDHRMLLRSGEWKEAGQLTFADELMPFYRVKANSILSKCKHCQYPRIFTLNDGWKTQNQFLEEWRTGKKDPDHEKLYNFLRLSANHLTTRQLEKAAGHEWVTINNSFRKYGWSHSEIKWLHREYPCNRRILSIEDWVEVDVYDLSVKEYQNFCSDSTVFHNCQTDDNEQVVSFQVKNKAVRDELNKVAFHREYWNLNHRYMWNLFKKMLINGDVFLETIIDVDNPKFGILKIQSLPPESMFRIENIYGKLYEFQQSQFGPDYTLLSKSIDSTTEQQLRSARLIARFAAEQIVHIKIGEDRETFAPYGISIIENARGAAHSLRLMEDAMLIYRLTRAPERRVFYVDIGTLPPAKSEGLMKRMQDQFRKKKVTGKSPLAGASSVEERWQAPSQDEDYWLPVRGQSSTRIETLPGAQNLGEIDDALYFRNKLYIALNFPKPANEPDVNSTRITLSYQNVNFAKMIERFQGSMEEGIYQLAYRHLTLLGIPEELYSDLTVKMTKPSAWKELSEQEVKSNRINNASSLKGSQLFSDYDIYVDYLKIPEEEAQAKLSRLKVQKLEDLKLQIIGQNPQIAGVGMPGSDETEVGAQPGGPNPDLNPDQPQPDQNQGAPEQGMDQAPPEQPQDNDRSSKGLFLPEPEDEYIKKYDLSIADSGYEKDVEDIDYSVTY